MEVVMDMSVMAMDMMITRATGTRVTAMDMMTTKAMGTRVMAMGMMIIRAMDTRVTMDMAIMNITTNMCTTIEQKQINHILVKDFFPFLWVKIENVTSKKEEVKRMVGNDCPSDL